MVRFEPFVMYRYEYLGGRERHLIWGEFVDATAAREERQGHAHENPQLTSMSTTVERLRQSVASCVLIADGEPVAPLPKAPHVLVRSRVCVGEHNGVLFLTSDPDLLFLMDLSTAGPVGHAQLADDPFHPCALLLGPKPIKLPELASTFERATSLENLKPKLFDLVDSCLGFDHEAFFTLETTDTSLARDALHAATLPGEPGTRESTTARR